MQQKSPIKFLSRADHEYFLKLYEMESISQIKALLRRSSAVIKRHIHLFDISREIRKCHAFISRDQIPIFIGHISKGMPLKQIAEKMDIPFGLAQKVRTRLCQLNVLPRHLFLSWPNQLRSNIFDRINQRGNINHIALEYQVSLVEVQRMKILKDQSVEKKDLITIDQLDEYIKRGVDGLGELSEKWGIAYDNLMECLHQLGMITWYKTNTCIDKVNLKYEEIEVLLKLYPCYTPTAIALHLGKRLDEVEKVINDMNLQQKFSYIDTVFKPSIELSKKIKNLAGCTLDELSLETGLKKELLRQKFADHYLSMQEFDKKTILKKLSKEEIVELSFQLGAKSCERINLLSYYLTPCCIAIVMGLEEDQVKSMIDHDVLLKSSRKEWKHGLDLGKFMIKLRENVGNVKEIMKELRTLEQSGSNQVENISYNEQLKKLASAFSLIEIAALMHWKMDSARNKLSKLRIKTYLRPNDISEEIT